MEKNGVCCNINLWKKRTKKKQKRNRKNKKYGVTNKNETREISFRKKFDSEILRKHKFDLDDFLEERGNKPNKKLTKEIEIPVVFSLELNYEETVLTVSLIRKCIFLYKGARISINFSKCNYLDVSSLFLLRVILEEYIAYFRKLQSRLLYYNVKPSIMIKHSLDDKVNLTLLSCELIGKVDVAQSEFIPVSLLKLIKGSKQQKHYAENKKGKAATMIRDYINEGLKRHKFELNYYGISHLDGIIGEILNNAEDHSLFDRWYAFGNLFEKGNSYSNKVVGEINLAFLNFGYSISEGFEETKTENTHVYHEMSTLCDKVLAGNPSTKVTKECLFTLYALQEGNSRLKFEEQSRGTGTMTFIRSFLNLGDYEDAGHGITPSLTIYSGAVRLKCDNRYKPFEEDGVYFLSLNDQKDLRHLPEGTHLEHLQYRFPGTLISVRIYLNQEHLESKIQNNNISDEK